MGIAKKIRLNEIFIFLFLIIFPFGQIIRLSFNFAGMTIPLQPLDIIVGMGALYSVLFQKERPKVFNHLKPILAIVLFSFLLSVIVFKIEVVYGFFYLVRIFAYTLFLNYVWNFVKEKKSQRQLLINSLLGVSVFSAIFGWIQYFTVPDLKPLFDLGWDMHLYRLAGTFLDPTFLGLIIVFGLILSIHRFIKSKEKKYILITVFLLISLAFTYSRASYLAFLGGISVIALAEKKYRKIFLLAIGLILIALALPTAKNQSIKLTRTFSITAKLTNYKETLEVFKKYPIFGVGFDNLCVARNKFIGNEPYASHACSGSDSSLLVILATTGIVGLMIFGGVVFNIFDLLKNSRNLQILIAMSVALFIHSLFSNSLFFPWIMGYAVVILAASIKD